METQICLNLDLILHHQGGRLVRAEQGQFQVWVAEMGKSAGVCGCKGRPGVNF